MERFKRSLAFWVMLVVACVFATSPMYAQQKKKLFKAQIKIGQPGVGASLLQSTPAGYEVGAFTNEASGLFFVVTKVDLSIGDAREIVLCKNDDPVYDDCTYDADGNLDLETTISGPNFAIAGILGVEFRDALLAGNVVIQLNDGVLGSGNYTAL